MMCRSLETWKWQTQCHFEHESKPKAMSEINALKTTAVAVIQQTCTDCHSPQNTCHSTPRQIGWVGWQWEPNLFWPDCAKSVCWQGEHALQAMTDGADWRACGCLMPRDCVSHDPQKQLLPPACQESECAPRQTMMLQSFHRVVSSASAAENEKTSSGVVGMKNTSIGRTFKKRCQLLWCPLPSI